MRFIENGPWLPDPLLTARDAGQVIFFCGAGVSQAEAGLPNFPNLAGRVLDALGSALDSPARRLFKASQKFEKDSGLTGIVATDRIFGLLEREFDPLEVQGAVAEALRPEAGYGLGAHRTMLDLASDRAGVVRLVTTNFDLLFEECDPALASFNPPHLPDPRREKDFRGIFHIHGRVDRGYRTACDDEFVLSSADFGRAYLSDGWATGYIQALLQRYKIVFVGYSADDPPVQYLLEALNRTGDCPNELYAFQAGDVAQAAAQWAHKGVVPIPYDSADRHSAFWKTLEAWADRARDVDAWHARVTAMAANGPAALRPDQRGIVAHLAATTNGARRLAASADPLPAEWLCVLDPRQRYAAPGPVDPYSEDSERHDPFDALGLDCDAPPAQTDPNDRFSRRDVPEDAWDLLASTEDDRIGLPGDAAGTLRSAAASQPARLPMRLWHLGMYLNKVAHQPAALWWAAHQADLHPHIVDRIEWSMRQEAQRFSETVRRGWRLLIAAWRERRTDPNHKRYEIEALATLEGWSSTLVRSTMEMYRPQLTAKAPFATFAPPNEPDLPLERMMRPDVEYPRPHEPLTIPPEHLFYAVAIFRGQIEHAIALEGEIAGRDRIYFDTTRPDDGEELDEDGFQLTGHLATFINMMSRLSEFDATAAKAEFERWPAEGDQVFTRLRIWAASRPAILTGEEAVAVFMELDEESFWTDQHERDLLYALRDRWGDMPESGRRQIEQRLLTGSYPWPEPRENLAAMNAHYRLNRLQWLTGAGVRFAFDVDAAIAENRRAAPEWQPRFADRAAQPNVGKVRSIVTETDPTPLSGLSVGQILAAARDAARFDFDSDVERRPFLGLAEERPALALAVITDAARKGEFAEREWAALLHATSKGQRSARLLGTIALRLSKLSADEVAAIRHPVSEWLRDRAGWMFANLPDSFETTWNTLAAALRERPAPDRFRRADAGWVDDALSQPAGRMIDALFKDPAKAGFLPGEGLPSAWTTRLEQMLRLPGDARRHAIAMVASHLNWLFNIDPAWAEENLLSLADDRDADGQSFWAGYFWAARTPQLPLYMRLKPEFVALAASGTRRRDHSNKLAGMLLVGWAGEEGDPDTVLIPDVELREILIHADDELRTQMLWYLMRWSNEPDSRWGDRVLPFLRNVWPRQSAVKNPRTSGRLVDLALSMPQHFPKIVEAIIPRLGPIAGASVRMGPFLDIEEGVATTHPKHLLDLLWTVLPEDPWSWPYETSRVLDALSKQDAVRDDRRLTELRRREERR